MEERGSLHLAHVFICILIFSISERRFLGKKRLISAYNLGGGGGHSSPGQVLVVVDEEG